MVETEKELLFFVVVETSATSPVCPQLKIWVCKIRSYRHWSLQEC